MVTGGKKIASEYRALNPFSKVRLIGLVDVSFIQDGKNFIELRVAEGLQQNVLTEIRGGELIVENAARCNFMRNYKGRPHVSVHCDSLQAITLESFGVISCDDTLRSASLKVDCYDNSGSLDLLVNCSTLYLNNHTGVCRVSASGTCERFFGYSRATGPYDVTALRGNSAWLNNGSPSDMQTGYWTTLNAFVYYKGDISYRSGIVEQIVRKGEGEVVLQQ